MINFDETIFNNRQKNGQPFVVAHRGVSGANVPCNTLLSYKIALAQGADVVEIDITKSKDGEYFVFHPGMEKVFLKCGKTIPELTSKEVREIPLLNLDEVPTQYRIPTLREAFRFLQGKAYINVDKFWMDIEGITSVIRECGVEKQVIVKTPIKDMYLTSTEQFASDFMFMPLVRHTDMLTDIIRERKLNYIGVEALFDDLSDEVASPAYIREMHRKGYLVWVNAIVYDESDVISAGLTDDLSLEKGEEYGWGELIARGFDFIQTDWLLTVKQYLKSRREIHDGR